MAHHHSGHTHHHHSSTRVLIIGATIILVFAIIEAIGGGIAHSLALWSDAGHMAADSASLLLAAFAAWVAKRPPSATLSFGYGRAEVIAASLSSLLLVAIVIAIVIEAIHRIYEPRVVHGGIVAIIALVGLIANLFAAWVIHKGEKNMNTRAAILHVLSDAIGSIAAIIVGIVIFLTNWTKIDPILSLFISVIIAIATIRLLRETFTVLMEAVPKHLDLNEIGRSIAAVQGVHSAHDLHIWSLSSTHIMISAHIVISDFKYCQAIINDVKQLLDKNYGIKHITLQPEVNEFPLKAIKNQANL